MTRHPYTIADVFTNRVFGGNPLAVFPSGDAVPEALMPHIARELNLSETVFVLRPRDPAHTCRLRIFTPASELPFAGHPTVGTACVLAALGHVPVVGGRANLVFEEGVGPIPVVVTAGAGYSASFSAAKLPEQGPAAPDSRELARMLSLEPDDLLAAADRPEPWSCGVPFLFVPLRNRDAVRRARLNPAVWKDVLSGQWAEKVYVFARDAELSGSSVRARMFAPSLGIAEDPATGGAAAPLAGYLAAREATRDGLLRWRIEQGFEMGRPSIIDIEADLADGKVTAVRVSGESVIIGRGELELPDG